MHFTGSMSWRFAESVDVMPHVALYARDALRLQVPLSPGVPPALEGPVPDRRQVLDAEKRNQAGLQWTDWWNGLVADEARMHRGCDGPDRQAWPQGLVAARQATGAPPDFSALSDHPVLQAAAVRRRPGNRYPRRPAAPGGTSIGAVDHTPTP